MTCEKCGSVTADPLAVYVTVRDYEKPPDLRYTTELCASCFLEVVNTIRGEETSKMPDYGGVTTG